MEIRETHALGAEAIEVRRLQDGISVGGDVAVTLIIGKDEKNIRLGAGDGFGGSGGGCGRDGEKERQSDGENGAEGIHRRRGFVVRRWGRGGLECAFEAEGPERAEVEARANCACAGVFGPEISVSSVASLRLRRLVKSARRRVSEYSPDTSI